MTIIFNIDDFLFEIFPVEKGNLKELGNFLKSYYTEGPFEPKVEITENFVKIQMDTTRIEKDKKSYQRLVDLCEKGQYSRAKPLAKELIKKSPNISEYHRILGQIYSDEGNQDEAINCLIDALRWNPKNQGALLMMGNIFARFKEDIGTAMTYYNQVLIVKPNDYITLTNIGALLMQLDKKEEAIKYFHKAMKANPSYPNAHLSLALLYHMDGDHQKAFETVQEAITLTTKKDEVYKRSLLLARQSAEKWMQDVNRGIQITKPRDRNDHQQVRGCEKIKERS